MVLVGSQFTMFTDYYLQYRSVFAVSSRYQGWLHSVHPFAPLHSCWAWVLHRLYQHRQGRRLFDAKRAEQAVFPMVVIQHDSTNARD